jgi:hypothetical protein
MLATSRRTCAWCATSTVAAHRATTALCNRTHRESERAGARQPGCDGTNFRFHYNYFFVNS